MNIGNWFSQKKTQRKFDSFADPLTSRGSSDDRTVRLKGNSIVRPWSTHLELYKSNGILQTIIDAPANDAVREWITIKTSRDDLEINRMIENRLFNLNIQNKLFNLIRFSRLYSKGSWMFYGVIANTPQFDLSKPLPNEIEYIDYINVIDNPDHVSINEVNTSEPLKKDYRKVEFLIQGFPVHSSRISWLCNNYISADRQGVSVIDKVFDAISAQDSALWSCSSLVQDMATKVFKSDLVSNLSPSKQAELLSQLKHYMITLSALALTKDEEFQKLTYNVSGIREVFDFIIDNLAGVSDIPKNILLGKAHGVVTAGEYDTLNYYAKVKQYQELHIRPIIDKIIGLVIREKSGEVFKTIGNEPLDWEYDFNNLWILDPVSQADVDLKNSQRDASDFATGKVSSTELRSLDPRYSELQSPESEALRDVEGVFNEVS